nr:glycosyltransferase [Thermophagus xiamenensis]
MSNFSPDKYASNTNKKDVELLKNQFHHLPDSIKILGPMPNEKVLKLLKNSHVALLPTYADTYGYFVLEAQACGCPVISTDIRALPEINNNECGWIISVPKDKNGNGILKTAKDRKIFSTIIEKKLYSIVNEIILKPENILPKAEASIERIKKEHDPEKHANKLINIYVTSRK